MTLAKDTRGAFLEVLDPVAIVATKTVPPAPRLHDLNGRKIGLYWNTKPGGDIGLAEVARLLEGRFANLTFEKFQYRFPAGKASRDEVVKSGCNAIISTSAD